MMRPTASSDAPGDTTHNSRIASQIREKESKEIAPEIGHM